MNAHDIRTAYLEFFRKHGHTVYPSDSLVPENDPSVLFTPAGMNQFKDMFLGRGAHTFARAATSQKCLRTGDIDDVGKTPFHHTFFEMLGNFSFGDYFKEEAIEWSWQFMLEDMGVKPEDMVVSVYTDDDEAADIWERKIGVPAHKIYRYGEDANFWPANVISEGPNTVCGPCSEIHYDWGEEYGCGKSTCDPECDCRRYTEIWNLVFTQFDRKDGGVLEPLPSRNIDTGMGLERMTAVMQGVRTSFHTDLFQPIVAEICALADIEYDPDRADARQIRRIADHARAVAFCIADGVLPSNEGRGYVERRLLRRAAADGAQLGLDEPFLHKLAPIVARIMGDAYPEVRQRQDNVARIMHIEEERFHDTLMQGTRRLEELADRLAAAGERALPGAEAFKLYDTYGFPVDIAQNVLEAKGFEIDMEEYEAEMAKQREKARGSSAIAEHVFDTGPMAKVKQLSKGTRFVGYDKPETEAVVVALIRGEDTVESAGAGDEVTVVLDHTTFYGEAGGQVGDTGDIVSSSAKMAVAHALKVETFVQHEAKVTEGTVHVGDRVTTQVNWPRRTAIRGNHTATHLLHHALRQVLGEHAEQSGSLVTPERLRFDFSHFQAVTRDEIERVEDIVNEKILANEPVQASEMSLDQAKAQGAMALFGEKYGEQVRMVSCGGYSKELCGGAHVSRTGDIGLFAIVAETSVAAGIRRIEAVTSRQALARMRQRDKLIAQVCEVLNAQEGAMLERAGSLLHEIRDLRKELKRAKQGGGAASAKSLLAEAKEVAGTKVVTYSAGDVGDPNELRQLADQLRQTGSVASILAGINKGSPLLVVALTKDLVAKGLKAGEVAKAAAKHIKGGGGGKPDMAQAGGKDVRGIPKALEEGADALARALNACSDGN